MDGQLCEIGSKRRCTESDVQVCIETAWEM